MQVKPISNRGSIVCRGCDSKNLVSILNLGEQPLPAEYGMHADEVLDKFPLHLRVCKNCGLGQLGEYVLPERIFHETYPYLSSASEYWVNHATNFAKQMVNKLSLNKESLVIELIWEEKINYRFDDKIKHSNFETISFIKIIKKYFSKKIRNILK